MKNQEAKIVQLGADFPGREVVALDCEEGTGAVSVYASIPRLNIGAMVRVTLFAQLLGTRQQIASVICPEGTDGEVISASGHLADSWHVYACATAPQAQAKLGLMAKECCGPPKVWARADLLSLAFLDDANFPPLFAVGPFVPLGDDFGGAGAETLTGTSNVILPIGARITHWIAQANVGDGAIVFTDPSGGTRSIALLAGQRFEGFPDGRWPATKVAVTNVTFALVEWVD